MYYFYNAVDANIPGATPTPWLTCYPYTKELARWYSVKHADRVPQGFYFTPWNSVGRNGFSVEKEIDWNKTWHESEGLEMPERIQQFVDAEQKVFDLMPLHVKSLMRQAITEQL